MGGVWVRMDECLNLEELLSQKRERCPGEIAVLQYSKFINERAKLHHYLKEANN